LCIFFISYLVCIVLGFKLFYGWIFYFVIFMWLPSNRAVFIDFFFKFIIWYLVIKPLASLFVTFFLLIYPGLISRVNRLVKLTMIASYLFFSIFFMKLIVFIISYFDVKLLAFKLCNFSPFFYVGLSRVRVSQVNPS
jgi:hypothetical protein